MHIIWFQIDIDHLKTEGCDVIEDFIIFLNIIGDQAFLILLYNRPPSPCPCPPAELIWSLFCKSD